MRVQKRSGTIEDFKPEKIERAITLAWGEEPEPKAIGKIVQTVVGLLDPDLNHVEDIQDLIEVTLLRAKKFKVARAFIVYREKQAEKRLRRTKKVPDTLSIRDYIHAAKYARYLPEKKRRETRDETTTRVKEMHQRRFPHLHDEIEAAFSLVYEDRVLPSMRSLQFGGLPIERVHNRIYNCSATHIDRLEAFSGALYLLLCGCGVGYSVQFDHVDKLPTLAYINPRDIEHVVIEDTIEGWADAAYRLLHSYTTGKAVEFSYHLIRPEGSPLKISGGKAPGHLGLKKSLEGVRAVLHRAQGRKLRPVECHRIMCLLADAVLSGGIRRSSLICLFSYEDSEMMYLKTGNWYETEPYLANANNSVVLPRKTAKKKQFKKILQLAKQWGEPGFYFTEDEDYCTNPCFHPDTLLWTSEGYRRIEDLYHEGKPVTVVADVRAGKGDEIDLTRRGVKAMEATPVALTQKNAEVYQVTTEHGYRVKVTSAHEFPTPTGRKQLRDLAVGDDLLLPSGEGRFGSYGTAEEGYLLGLYVAQDEKALLSGIQVVKVSETGTLDGLEFYQWLGKQADDGDVASLKTRVPRTVWRGSRDFIAGYLSGIAGAETAFPHEIQILLSMFGIVSKILPDGKLDVSQALDHFLSGESDNQLFLTKIVDISYAGRCDVYCLTQETTNVVTANGLVTGQCSEIGLNPVLKVTPEIAAYIKEKKGVEVEPGSTFTGFAFCNLTEINASKLTSLADFQEAAKAATMIGTLQASYTTMHYLGWVSEVIAEREALLGVGMTGIMDAPEVALNPEYQRAVARQVIEWNREFAAKVGIRPASRTTCVKPSGCRPLGSLTTTDRGILTLEELLIHHPEGATWAIHPHDIYVYQKDGESRISRTFSNGVEPVYEITLSHGLTVRSTGNHPWMVISNGDYRWVEATNLKPGDVLQVSPGVYRKEDSTLFPNQAWVAGTTFGHLAHDDSILEMDTFNLVVTTPIFREIRKDQIPYAIRSESWRDMVAFYAGLLQSPWVFPEAFLKHLQQVLFAVGLCINRNLEVVEEHSTQAALQEFRTYRKSYEIATGPLGVIEKVEVVGSEETYDLEVEDYPWFYDGAVQSHNTSSLRLNCVGSGIHPHHARRYIRRVTANENEPVFQYFKQHNPHMCIKKPNGDWVIEFCVQAPEGAKVKSDLGALDFLEVVKSTQQNWVVPGTADPTYSPGLSHNVSNTVIVKPNEWDDIADYLWTHRELFTGVSFLPATGDKDYAYAPNEAITTEADEARWNTILEGYQPVDYAGMVEEEDSTDLTGEAACAGGACEVK